MIQRGEQAARQKWDELMALRKYIYADACDSAASDDTLQDKRLKQPKPSQTEAYHIGTIRLEGISGQADNSIRKQIALRENPHVSTEQIDGTIAMIRGLNIF